jgi:hypothetical protein
MKNFLRYLAGGALGLVILQMARFKINALVIIAFLILLGIVILDLTRYRKK